jgi:PAS domain S-box-containing protein
MGGSRVERALRVRDALGAFLVAARAPIIVVERDGRLVYANDATLSEYGYALEEIVAMRVHDLMAFPRPELPQDLERAFTGETRPLGRRPHRRKDGSVRWVVPVAGPVTVLGETLIVSVLQDVSASVPPEELEAGDERDAPRVPEVGEKVDRYVIEAVIGEGGMARVYRAFDPRLGRRVALKVLLAKTSNARLPGHAATRMMREAKAAAAFNHPNVVAVYDFGETHGLPFIVMELVAGAALRAYVKDPRVIRPQRLGWLVDIARGLGAAHRSGLVHRDIKPDNVMVTTEGHVKILDFGVARRAEGFAGVDDLAAAGIPAVSTLTEPGTLVGTPQYMAPEQLLEETIDGRADQFAWAVTAWELLTGKVPWAACRNGAQLVASIIMTPVPPLRDHVPDVDPRWSAAVARALSKNPGDRFPTMEDLLCTAIGAAPSAPPSPSSEEVALAETEVRPSARRGAGKREEG